MGLPDVSRLVASVAAGYLLGSLPFAYLAARAVGVNIFRVGSRNPGAANVFRAVDRRLGAMVFVADVLKGVAAIAAARAMGVPAEMAALAGAAAVAGHWGPVFLWFRGGAGLGPAVGAAVALSLIPGGVGLAVGLASVPVIRSSGHAAMVGLAALVLTGFIVGVGWALPVGAAGLADMVFGRYLVIQALGSRRAETPRDE